MKINQTKALTEIDDLRGSDCDAIPVPVDQMMVLVVDVKPDKSQLFHFKDAPEDWRLRRSADKSALTTLAGGFAELCGLIGFSIATHTIGEKPCPHFRRWKHDRSSWRTGSSVSEHY
jgi:hypothetical protein